MSYEKEILKKIESQDSLPDKLDIPTLKYFWQANPLFSSTKDSIPRFLRKIKVLKNFTEYELRVLSKSLHYRSFSHGEKIFSQSDPGVGFYFLYSGHVEIVVEKNEGGEDKSEAEHIVTLDRGEYFGELALLQENSIRNASAVAQESCKVLGFFKPDLENLINDHPVVATKLLQSISVIIANRLFSITNEVKRLKYKIELMEAKNGTKDKK